MVLGNAFTHSIYLPFSPVQPCNYPPIFGVDFFCVLALIKEREKGKKRRMVESVTMLQCAPHACNACSIKKRKCDRHLPSCKRCLRVKQHCTYGKSIALFGDAQEAEYSQRDQQHTLPIQPWDMQIARPLNACTRCRAGKRRCSRTWPSCSRCDRQGVSCDYNFVKDSAAALADGTDPTHSIGERALMTLQNEALLARLTTANEGEGPCSRCKRNSAVCVCELNWQFVTLMPPDIRQAFLQHTTAALQNLYGPCIKPNYPVEHGYHIPMILKHFCSLTLMPVTIGGPKSLATHVQTTWMQYAMQDACLFHATIYSASAQMDKLRCISNSPVTVFHHVQALKLLRERVTSPGFQPDYATIATALALSYFNMTVNDIEGALTHNRGLLKMLESNKNNEPDITGLMALSNETLLAFCMILNKDLPLLPFDGMSSDSSSTLTAFSSIQPSNLVGRVLSRASSMKRNILSSLTIFQLEKILCFIAQIEETVTLTPADLEYYVNAAYASQGTDQDIGHPCDDDYSSLESINECCQLAVKVFWDSIGDGYSVKPRTHTMHENIEKLRKLAGNINLLSWLRNAPEAYVWVHFTAGAACSAEVDRIYFIMTAMPVITASDTTELRMLREGCRYVRWLGEMRAMNTIDADLLLE